VIKRCAQMDVLAVPASHYTHGGEGAAELAKAVVAACERNRAGKLEFLYPLDAPLRDKIAAVAQRVYRAKDVSLGPGVGAKLAKLQADGFGHLPICVAKNQCACVVPSRARARHRSHARRKVLVLRRRHGAGRACGPHVACERCASQRWRGLCGGHDGQRDDHAWPAQTAERAQDWRGQGRQGVWVVLKNLRQFTHHRRQRETEGMACAQFRADPSASDFLTCVCGHSKRNHGQTPSTLKAASMRAESPLPPPPPPPASPPRTPPSRRDETPRVIVATHSPSFATGKSSPSPASPQPSSSASSSPSSLPLGERPTTGPCQVARRPARALC